MAMNGCAECLKKPREIDRLTEALQRLQAKAPLPGTASHGGFFRLGDPVRQAARQDEHSRRLRPPSRRVRGRGIRGRGAMPLTRVKRSGSSRSRL